MNKSQCLPVTLAVQKIIIIFTFEEMTDWIDKLLYTNTVKWEIFMLTKSIICVEKIS